MKKPGVKKKNKKTNHFEIRKQITKMEMNFV